MHKICQAYHQKCFEKNNVVNFILLWIKLKPMDAGLPSFATLHFHRPIRALLLHINSEPINYNAYDEKL